MPWLRGIEVLPQQESDAAISECEAVERVAASLLSQTQAFLRGKLAEVKRYSKELSASSSELLAEEQARLNSLAAKLATFKKDIIWRLDYNFTNYEFKQTLN